MKKNLSFILLLLMSFHAANAQTFATLWKQVETAQQKDMPQSQIAALNQIIDKAKATKSYGHLLKAGLLRIEARQEISRDSLKGDIAQFSREAAQTKSTQPVLHAVYCMLLGRIYQNYYIERINTQDSTKYYFKQAMAQPELLAGVQADSYEPLTIKGIDSGIFHNDLLHVIGIETNHYAALYRYYTAHNNRAAACISAALMMQQQADEETVSARKSRNLQKIDSLIAEYKDLEEAGELAITRYQILRSAEDVSAEEQIRYIDYALSHWGGWRRMNELRNARKELTQPSFQVSLGKEVLLPNRAHQIPILSICNISSLTMKVWRTSLKGDTGLEANNAKDYARIKKHIVSKTLYEETKRYVGLPDYKVTRDTMQLGALQPGVYLVEFSTDNKNISPERALLRVSNLYLVTQALPDKEQRLVVLNATTGEPVSNAKIRVTYRSYYQKKDIVETLTCNELGEVYAKEKKNFNMDFFIFTQDDAYGKVMGESSNFYPAYSRSVRNLTAIFTDRSIYRPGQTVHASVIAYQDLKGEDMAVAPNRKIELVLRDANYKEVERKAVTTDSYGTASADFALPRNGLTGRFSLHTAHGNASFRVEEYKRPTFKIEFEKVKQQYADGDSIQVQGTAKSFAGAPMPGVRVTYTVTRRPSYRWWFMPSGGDHRTIAQDTVVTDSKGMFKIPVKLVLPEKGKQNEARFFNFDIEVSATNAAGETQEGATSLPLSDKKTMFYAEVPEMLNKKDSLQVNFLYQNNAGENLDGTVRYRFGDTDAWQTTSANKEMRISVNHLASGRHTLTAMCENDTLTRKIILFSLDDKHVPVDTLDWFYQVENTFKADKMPARIQLGTSAAEQHIVYTVMAGNKVIEQGTLDLKNELYTHTFTYQPQYEKGIVVSYAWVKNGNLYRHEAIIACELPDKRLQLQWQTFRNRLTPGQKEEWTLRVTRPNGQARQAQVLAGMYDKSLDMITPHSFSLYSTLGLSFPQLRWWADEYSDEETLYGEQPLNLLPARSLLFTRLFNDIADDYPMGSSVKYTAPLIKSRALSKDIAFEAHASAMEKGTVADVAAENITFATKAEVSNAKTQPQTSVQVRQNLNETAFFYPNIETNQDGVATIQFTLPESVTTWKFMALAHDKEMNFGMLTDEAVAKKIVIIQPNVPRFMRQGDKGWLSAQVSNTSDRAIQGTATLQFLDAETQKVLYTKQQAYKLAAEDATTVRFEIETAQLPALVIARFTASGKDYSDGEQHYLPILSNAEWLTNTVAFTQHEPGKTTIDLAKLFPAQSTRRKLTVEYTNNPAWLVIQSLPALADAHENNAIDLASAYYANTTAAAILQSAPHIKTVFDIWRSEPAEKGSLASALQQNEELKTIILNETPWVLDADKEAKQKQLLVNFFDESQVAQRLSSQLQSLTKLQNPDGSFSWYPGMRGSFYVTLSVAETLARLQVHHLLDTPVQNMLNNAIGFLQKTVKKEVAEMKKAEKKGAKEIVPSEDAIHYLYVHTLNNGKGTASNGSIDAYLLSKLAKAAPQLTIYGKANTAYLLFKNKAFNADYARIAAEHLNSLKEYTVYKEDMGRYFDTHKAYYSWLDYRIPTQVAAIEALQDITPGDTRTIEEMQRWLLQAKRTQRRENHITAVDAAHAFLGNAREKLQLGGSEPATTLKVNDRTLETSKATAGLGYVKATETNKTFTTFTAEKQSKGTSWGAVYAQFEQKAADASAHGEGFTIERELLCNGKPVSGQSLKVGDKVTVRITIRAERDYDFVQVSDKRAACLESAEQLSGYRGGSYCSPKDNATYYYFDHMRKGTHTLSNTYYVDRSGVYQTGTCTVQCAYSPEFMARSTAPVLTVQ